MTRVLLCEDDPRYRALMKRTLEARGFAVAAACGSGEEALAQRASAQPDVALVDIELPGIDGIETARRLLAADEELEVLMLTSFADEARVFEAMRAGAAGYLVKANSSERVADAIITVLGGGAVIDAALGRRFWNLFAASAGRAQHHVQLDDEERAVLQLVARGLTNPEAALALGASQRAVKRRLAAVYRKLGVHGRVEASVEALRLGLVEL
ncbi:MAG: response regulator transcription factor [Myxococcales bacterium]|nr:response regulator transcription factor [Myxococcales bacterium]